MESVAKKNPTIPLNKCAVSDCNREGYPDSGVLLCSTHLVIKNIVGWEQFCKDYSEVKARLK